MIHHGDCLEVMAATEPGSVDAIVTDPPYDLVSVTKRFGGTNARNTPAMETAEGSVWARKARGFMGKSWDGTGVAFRPETWALALAVAKPGAYLLAFGGTRTFHRLASAIEDAGWEIRDCLVWAYASGFPKSLNLPGGLGTALKPAWEPIVMARKPLVGTVARNVAEHGTGALNIDATRIGYVSPDDYAATVSEQSGPRSWKKVKTPTTSIDLEPTGEVSANPAGRWPANVILTDPIFDGGVDGVVGGGDTARSAPASGPTWEGPSGSPSRSPFTGMGDRDPAFYGDSGTYSRFFLIPKADRADREPVLGVGPERVISVWGGDEDDLTPGKKSTVARRNVHPTVKPTELMRHLVRLVTPPGGLVLDPFLGSGTTGLAAEMEGFRWIGIEKEAEYVAIAEARLNGTQRGLGLDVAAPTPKGPTRKDGAIGGNKLGAHFGAFRDGEDVA